MPTLYLHVGTHKTASTTIQEALRRASRGPEPRSWVFIPRPAGGREFMRSESYDSALVNELHAQVEKVVRRPGSAAATRRIMSFEGFSGSPAAGYLNSGVVAQMLRDGTRDYDTRIVVYLRRQDEWLESMYTQSIHVGGSWSFDEFRSAFRRAGALDYDRLLGDFESRFGPENVIVRSYHAAAARGILADFGEIVGVPTLGRPSEGSDAGRSNPSYSRDALEIARFVNPQLSADQKNAVRRVLQKVLPKAPSDTFTFLAANERQECWAGFEASNRRVADRHFQGDLSKLFPVPGDSEPIPDSAGLTYEAVGRLLMELVSAEECSAARADAKGARATGSGIVRFRSLVRRLIGRA